MIWKVFDFLTPRNFIFNPFYVIKVSQDFKVLHWAVIRSGNLPVSALQALVLQYLFTPNSNFKNFFWTSSSSTLDGSSFLCTGTICPKFQSRGYLPVLRIRLHKVIKCLLIESFPTFNTSFSILSMPRALFALISIYIWQYRTLHPILNSLMGLFRFL